MKIINVLSILLIISLAASSPDEAYGTRRSPKDEQPIIERPPGQLWI